MGNPFTVPVRIKFSGEARELYDASAFSRATSGSAGFDLRAVLPAGEERRIAPGERCAIGTGLAVEPLRAGVAGFVYSRSGLGAVQGLTVAQGVGLIDPDYRGEIIVYLLNTSQEERSVTRGERIAQIVFQPFFQPVFEAADSLGDTARGAGGFGHSGKH